MQCDGETTFNEGEKVLCFHLGFLYEAKILKLDTEKGFDPKRVQYFVHYNGWKKTWDEWVPESKLLKLNEINREKQKELRAKGGIGSGSSVVGGGGGGALLSPNAPSSNIPIAPLKSSRRSKANETKTDDEAASSDFSLPPPLPKIKSLSLSSSLAMSSSPSGGAQKENNNNCDKRSNFMQNGKKAGSSKNRGGVGGDAQNVHNKTLFSPVMVVGGTSTRPIMSGGGIGQRGRSQKLTDDGKDGPSKRQRIELPIRIPETLKKVLVEDWDLVSRQTHLLVVPASVNVETVLNDYLTNREALPDPCIRSEFVASLKEYFNVMLGPQLLYRFERNQFTALEEEQRQRDGFLPSKYYGAVHLLRLFVKLGTVLSYTPLSQEECRMLLDVSHDFLDFLLEEQSRYFVLKPLFYPANQSYVDGATQGVIMG